MPFMVIYRTSDGSSCFEQADAIDEAALFVERLRNKEGIDQIRIYRMEEISFAFRPYYKVELGLAERQTTPTPSPSTASVVEAEGTDVDDVVPTDVEPPPADKDAGADVAEDGEAAEHPVSTLPAPPPRGEGEPAGANGRRGLFGR
jgi:hypothetical protein